MRAAAIAGFAVLSAAALALGACNRESAPPAVLKQQTSDMIPGVGNGLSQTVDEATSDVMPRPPLKP